MATPHVTGAAALYHSMNPGASAQSIKTAILASAENTPTSSMNGITVTDGRLNVGAFVSGPPATPPGQPTDLWATGVSSSQINLSWTDGSTDEQGFAIERCQGSSCSGSSFQQIAAVGAGVTSYENTGLAASTTYRYRVRAYKATLFSSYSNIDDGTTQAGSQPPPPAISLTATGYKTKGVQHADLRWTPTVAGANVDVYRAGVKVATTPHDGVHDDNINKKGGGSYSYQICPAGTTTGCSNTATVTF
jgi:hypothetical protein